MDTRSENLILFVSDACRYDYGRDYLIDEYELPGTFVKGVAPGTETVTSFPSIVSGLLPDEHHVSSWSDRGIMRPTVFDLDQWEYDTGYFCHPSSPTRSLLGNPSRRQLTDLDPPFVYVEREMATHSPYGTSWWRQRDSGNDYNPIRDPIRQFRYPEWDDPFTDGDRDWATLGDYSDSVRAGHVDIEAAYSHAVELAVDRFLDHVSYLESEGILDDTFVVFVADHGDVWGHHDGRPGQWMHGVMAPEVIEVPVLFYDRDVDVMRPFNLVDLIELWCADWPDVRSDLDLDRDGPVEISGDVRERLKNMGYL